MTMRSLVVPTVVSGCLSVLAACDLQEPDRYVRAPIIKNFAPEAPTLFALVGDSLRFSMAAEDPQGQELTYRFMLGDSAAWTGAAWTYVVEDTGTVEVRGCVSNGVSESAIQWRLTRTMPVNHPPEIIGFSPPESDISLVVGNSVEFVISAIDPEGQPLQYVYFVDESIVYRSRRYTYESSLVGVFDVRAVVSDGETFASHGWVLHVAAEPDSVAPAQVTVVSIGPGPETGEVDIEWMAVGDDSMTGMPAYYVVRTSPVPIKDEDAWDDSSDRDGEPTPVLPGQTMKMTVRDLPPANDVWVAVKAVDDFGLTSPLSALASTKARGMKVWGVVRDAVTEGPIENVRVTLSGFADTTDADGSFTLSDLPAVESFIRVEDDPWRTELGSYFDVMIWPYIVRDKDFLEFWMLPNVELETALYDSFLEFYKEMTLLNGCVEQLLGRWDIPCRVCIPALTVGGLDYAQLIRDAFLEWEGLIGLDLFEFVEDIPEEGIYVTYGEPDRDFYIITKRDANCLPVQGRINLRTAYTAPSDSLMRLVTRHEIGHAIRLNHSEDDIHIMFPTPQVAHASEDEIKLVRAMYRIPRGFPTRWLLND